MSKTGDPYLLYVSRAFNDKDSLGRYLEAMQFVVDRHDVLHTAFIWENLSAPVQLVWRNTTLSIVELQLNQSNGPIP